MDQLHTFGGSALDRHVFDFDTDDGIGDLGVAPPDPVVDAVDNGDAWSLSQDDWSALQETNARLQETVEHLARIEAQRAAPYLPQQQDADEPVKPDPWERPDTYHEDLERYVDSKIAPFRERFDNLDQQDGQERIKDVISDLEAEKGEFFPDTRDAMHALVMARSKELFPSFAQKMGYGDPAAEAAMEAAFTWAKEVEAKIAGAGVSRHTNEISTLAGAGLPPGSSYSEGLRVRQTPDWRQDGRSIAEKLLAES